MKLVPFFTILASAISASSVLANPCAYDDREHFYTTGEILPSGAIASDYQDLGNGTVLYHLRNWDASWSHTSKSSFRVLLCQPGQFVDVIYKARCGSEIKSYCRSVGLKREGSFEVDPTPIKQAIIEMARSNEAFSWRKFKRVLGELGARPVGPVTSEIESCGCAVYYPELVGDKRPDSVRDTISGTN